MVRQVECVESLTVPEGVDVSVKNRVVTVKGPRGTLVRDFRHGQYEIFREGDKFTVRCWFGSQLQRAGVRTIVSHVENMITGVTKGFRYTMRVCYRFFSPEIVFGKANEFVDIVGFMHGAEKKHFQMPAGCTVRPDSESKEQFIIEGNSIEELGCICSGIRQACRFRDKDFRVFLDGVYVASSGPIEE